MSNSTDRIRAELESIGYETSVFESPHGVVVAFQYEIEVGSHRGKEVSLGVSFQEEGYPDYPPHWIHVSPPLSDQNGGSVQSYTDSGGRQWLAMSRPPGELWDRLPTKHMSSFLSEHVRRIWRDV